MSFIYEEPKDLEKEIQEIYGVEKQIEEEEMQEFRDAEDKRAREIAAFEKKMSKTIKFKRNDKCPCGSGKKFKKCCIEKISNRQPLKAFLRQKPSEKISM